MKRIYLCLALGFIAFSLSVFGQNPLLTAAPPASDNSGDVVRISTTLIQVDVSATDKNGKIIRDLKPEDFEIYENQNKQAITNFSFVDSENKDAPDPVTNIKNKNLKGNAIIPIPPAKLKPENMRRTIAFVIDDLNLSTDSIFFIKKALKDLVDKQIQDDDLIAIIRTEAGTGTLQQFTSNKRLLYAAIENIRWNPKGANGIDYSNPDDLNNPDNPNNPGYSGNTNEQKTEAEKGLNEAENQYKDFRQSAFGNASLSALNYVVNSMKDLPGRKSVIFVCDGIQMKNRKGESDEKVLGGFQSVAESAIRASVVIYTMSANGLPYHQEFMANKSTYPNPVSAGDLSPLQRMMSAENNKRLNEVKNQQGLIKLSKETGGIAMFNRKDTSANIQMMLDDQKGYYLLGFQPDEQTFNAQTAHFNTLTIKVNRLGVKIRYRSGFFGLTDDEVNIMTTKAKLTPSQQIDDALTSPFAKNNINMRLASLFGDAAGTSFVRVFLNIQSKDLTFTDEADGSKTAVFDVFAFIFAGNGLPVEQSSKRYSFHINRETYNQISGGFVYNFNMPVKNPGVYQLRLALRDIVTQKIGTASQFIEVPDLKKNKLTLSGIILQNFTPEEWQKAQSTDISTVSSDKTQNDTAVRHFKRGSILSFGYTIYNAKLDKDTHQPNLQTQTRLYREQKMILEGQPKSLDLSGQKDLDRIATGGAIQLANQMEPGEYILQMIVTDVSAKGKSVIATQLIDFEVE